MSRMRLRPACSQDLPSIADLAAQAMLEDELFTYLCPHRYEQYPSFRYGFLRRLKKRLVTPGHVMMVAVENGTLGAGELIRGYAVWERIGKVGVPQLNDTWGNALERKLLALEDRYLALVSPDCSVDQHRLEHYTAVAVDCFPFSEFPDIWFLTTLAVDPKFQRRGIGQQLVQWGMEQALRENVPLGLEASAKGIGLYERLGFRTVNTTELIPGITIQAMLCNSKSLSDNMHD